METTKAERVRVVLKHYELTVQKLAEAIGISQSSMSNQLIRNSISQDAIEYLLSTYDDVNPYWLLFGRGEMFKSVTADMGKVEKITAKIQKDKPSSLEDHLAHQDELIDKLISLGAESQERMIMVNKIVEKLAGVCESFATSIATKEVECKTLRQEVASVHALLSEIVSNMCHHEGKQINFHETHIGNQNI